MPNKKEEENISMPLLDTNHIQANQDENNQFNQEELIQEEKYDDENQYLQAQSEEENNAIILDYHSFEIEINAKEEEKQQEDCKIDLSVFKDVNKDTNFMYFEQIYNFTSAIMEQVIQGRIQNKEDIQQFISGPYLTLTNSLLDTDPKNLSDMEKFAKGCVYLWKAFEFALFTFEEYEGLYRVLESSLSFQPNFYNDTQQYFDIKNVLNKAEKIYGKPLQKNQIKFEQQSTLIIFSIRDVMKAKMSELNMEKIMIQTVRRTNNVFKIKQALNLIRKFLCELFLNRQYKELIKRELLPSFSQIPTKIINNIKQLPLNFVEKMMKTLKQSVYDLIEYREIPGFLSRLELECHLVYFQSQQLQHRVAGITNLISKMRSIAEDDILGSGFDNDNEKGGVSNKLYSNEMEIGLGIYADSLGPATSKKFLVNWFAQKELFQRIFCSESLHHEIIKRSFPLVNFLYQQKALSLDSIFLIYRLALGKHHSVRSCLFVLLNNVADILSISDLRAIFLEIKNTPLSEIDLDYLLFIKALATNSRVSTVQLTNSPSNYPTKSSQQVESELSLNNQEGKKGNQNEMDIDMEEYGTQQQKYLIEGGEGEVQRQMTAFIMQYYKFRSLLISSLFLLFFINKSDRDETNQSNEHNQTGLDQETNAVINTLQERIQKNQNEFDDITCDQSLDRTKGQYNESKPKHSISRRQNKGRTYHKRGDKGAQADSNSNRGRYITILSEEAILIFDFLWQIIVQSSVNSSYNQQQQQNINSQKNTSFLTGNGCEQTGISDNMIQSNSATTSSGNSVVIEKSIAIIKELIEVHSYKPIKFRLLNKCIEMLQNETMLDECLVFVKLLNSNLPIEDLKCKTVISSSEELFTQLDQKSFYEISIVHGLQKIKYAFVKAMNLLRDSSKPSLEEGIQEEEEECDLIKKDNKSPSEQSPQNYYEIKQNEQKQQQSQHLLTRDAQSTSKEQDIEYSAITKELQEQEEVEKQVIVQHQKQRLEALKIPYINSKLLNSIEEGSSQSVIKLEKAYIECCQLRLSSIVESLLALRRSFSVELVKQLFEIFCTNEFVQSEQVLFYQFLTSLINEQRTLNKLYQHQAPKPSNSQPYELINKECAVFIFSDILLRLDIQYFSQTSVAACLESYFFYINEYIQALQQIPGPSPVINVFPQSPDQQGVLNYCLLDADVVGIQRFWDLCLRHQDVNIQNRAGVVLARLLIAASNNSQNPQVAQNIRLQYIDQIMKNIKESYQQVASQDHEIEREEDYKQSQTNREFSLNLMRRSLDLLSKLLVHLDKIQSSKSEKSFHQSKSIIITCDNQIQDTNKEKFSIEVKISMTTRDVFNIISDKIVPRQNAELLDVYAKGKNLSSLDKTLQEYKIDSNCTFFINKKEYVESIQIPYSSNQQAIPLGCSNTNTAAPQEDYTANLLQIKDIMGDTHSDEFLKFLLREKNNNLEEAINCLTDEFDTNEMQGKFVCEESSKVVEEIQIPQPEQDMKHEEQVAENQMDISDQQEQHLESLSGVISSREEYMDLLFDVLEVEPLHQARDTVWNIISILPVSKQQRQTLSDLCMTLDEDIALAQWDSFLNIQNKHVVLYRLQMIARLIKPNKQDAILSKLIKSFRLNFLRAHGFTYLYNSIVRDDETASSIKKQSKAIHCSLTIIHTYINALLVAESPSGSPLALSLISSLKLDSKKQEKVNNLPHSKTPPQPSSPFFGPMNNPNLNQVAQLKDEEIAQLNQMKQKKAEKNSQNQQNQQSSTQEEGEIQAFINDLKQENDLFDNLKRQVNLTELAAKSIELIDYSSSLLLKEQENVLEDILLQSLQTIQNSILADVHNFTLLQQSQSLPNIITFQLFPCPLLRVREKTKDFLIELANLTSYHTQEIESFSVQQCFVSALLKNLIQFVSCIDNAKYDEYLQTLIYFLFKSTLSGDIITLIPSFSVENLFSQVIEQIDKRPVIETRLTNNQDRVLGSLFELAQELVLKNRELADKEINLTRKLVDYLFYMPNQDMDVQDFVDLPKCKHRETRKAAFKLVLLLCSHSITNFQLVFATVKAKQYHLQTTEYETDVNLKPSHGFAGLRNLGSTCYINSLLQQFYMIKDFRNAILNINIPISDQQSEEISGDLLQQMQKDNTAAQLQILFAQMRCTIKQYINPIPLIESIKGYDGSAINVRLQEDVNEFFNRITDKIEQNLKLTEQKTILQELIGGQLSNEIISLEEDMPFLAETIEPFLTITVDIQKCKNLFEALDAQVKGDALEGENMYFCEKYNKKIRAQKRSCIKNLPNTLVLTLKRFDFDYNTMERKKINDYFEFPLDLNLKQWTKQNLFEQEGRNLNETDIHHDSYYSYTLAGVLVHNGTAESGHYYSFIKNREDNNWYEFNDSTVREFKIANLPEECYGGKSQFSSHNEGLWEEFDSNKSKNAYILFYERVQPSSHQFADLVKKDIPNSLSQKIKNENREFWQSRFIFDSDYLSFVRELLFAFPFPDLKTTKNISYSMSQLNRLQQMQEQKQDILMIEKSQGYQELTGDQEEEEEIEDIPFEETIEFLLQHPSIQVVEFALRVFLKNQLKQKEYQNVCEALKRFQEVFSKNAYLCFWFLDVYISENKGLIVSLILDQFNMEVREKTEELLKICLNQVLHIELPYLLVQKKFKLIKDVNAQFKEIEVIKESPNCIFRFLSFFMIELYRTFINFFNRSSNYLKLIRYLINQNCIIIAFMNEKTITKEYMITMITTLKRQINLINQYQDQDVTNNIKILSDIITQIAIKCQTQGMIVSNSPSPVYQQCQLHHIHSNLIMEEEIEFSSFKNFKDLMQICAYVSDPYFIFQHIAWGNKYNSLQIMIHLREIVYDYNFDSNQLQAEYVYKMVQQQFELQDGLTLERIQEFFVPSEEFKREKVLLKMYYKSKYNETMVLEFIKWLCSYSSKNQEFTQYLNSQKLENDTKWILPYLIELNYDKNSFNNSYPSELAKQVYAQYKITIGREHEANKKSEMEQEKQKEGKEEEEEQSLINEIEEQKDDSTPKGRQDKEDEAESHPEY